MDRIETETPLESALRKQAECAEKTEREREIERTLDLFHAPGSVVEIRVLQAADAE